MSHGDESSEFPNMFDLFSVLLIGYNDIYQFKSNVWRQ